MDNLIIKIAAGVIIGMTVFTAVPWGVGEIRDSIAEEGRREQQVLQFLQSQPTSIWQGCTSLRDC